MILKCLHKKGCTPHNKPVALLNQEMFQQKLAYIHNNPVIAGFVEKPEDKDLTRLWGTDTLKFKKSIDQKSIPRLKD